MYLATSHGAYQDLRAHFQIILASILSSGKDPQWQLLSERKDDEGSCLVSTKAALLLCFIYSDSSLNFLCEKGSTADTKIIDITELRSLDDFQETWLFWSHEATPAWIQKGSGCLTLWGTDHCIYFHLNLSLEKQKQDFNPEIIFLTNPWTGVDYPTGYDAAGEALNGWPSAMQLDNSGAQWPPSYWKALPMVPLPAVIFEHHKLKPEEIRKQPSSYFFTLESLCGFIYFQKSMWHVRWHLPCHKISVDICGLGLDWISCCFIPLTYCM